MLSRVKTKSPHRCENLDCMVVFETLGFVRSIVGIRRVVGFGSLGFTLRLTGTLEIQLHHSNLYDNTFNPQPHAPSP